MCGILPETTELWRGVSSWNNCTVMLRWLDAVHDAVPLDPGTQVILLLDVACVGHVHAQCALAWSWDGTHGKQRGHAQPVVHPRCMTSTCRPK